MTENAFLNISRPQLGNPFLGQVIRGNDVRIDISVDYRYNVSQDEIRQKFLWPGPEAEPRIWLQPLENTRKLFQGDTKKIDDGQGWYYKTDNYVMATCDMNRWPQGLKDCLIPLRVFQIGPPKVLSTREGLEASRQENVDCGWNYLDYAFYENPGYPKHVGPYRWQVSLLLLWRDFERLHIELPQLFNLIYAVDMTALSRKFHDNFATCTDFDNVRAFNINFHSVYLHQKNWEDFSFLHLTDSHIAWRNDNIDKVIKEAKPDFDSSKYINWNKDLRDLITYANEAHRLGNLDFILITGDLVDFISRHEIVPQRMQSGDILNGIELRSFHKVSEDDIPALNCKTFPIKKDWHAGDSLSGLLNGNIWEPLDNFEFFHDLVTAFPRSGDCPVGDELQVPIFTVLGNHDYREYAYPLCGEVKWQGLIHVAGLNYFSSFGLSKEEAKYYSNEICSIYWQDDGNKFGSYRSTMHPTYYQLINNAHDFTIRLGRHRLVCLDTSHDVGVMEGVGDLISQGHAEDDWEAGNPDSAAFSGEQMSYLGSVIRERQVNAGGKDGLVIIACHSPLVNYGVPAAGAPLDLGVKYISSLPTPNMRESIRRLLSPDKTPWFAQGARIDARVHCGVASAMFPEFMIAIKGSVPLVLTGHSHHSVEYIALPLEGKNELLESSYIYLHDYYLDNTMGSVDAASHPAASPDADPALYPYLDPLSRSTDPENWWRNHQPLMIQTEQLFSRPEQDLHRSLGRFIEVKSGQITSIRHLHLDELLKRDKPTRVFFADDVLFAAYSNGILVKIRSSGGTGQDMFALTDAGGTISGLPGYDYWLGTQLFNARVSDLIYEDGVTLIGLDNGKVLKVRGTGGTGQNMFAINETDDGFESAAGYDYLIGSQCFGKPVNRFCYLQGDPSVLFVVLKGSTLSDRQGTLIKIKSTGGSGTNMFALKEEGDTITGLPDYDYWLGTQHFSGPITGISHVEDATLISLRFSHACGLRGSGKVLKVRGTGGTGQNMFAINETDDGFESAAGYDYLIGSQTFTVRERVNGLYYVDGNPGVLFVLGAPFVLKIKGAGGSGTNMFALKEEGDTITGLPDYDYWLGTQQFSPSSTVTSMLYADEVSIIAMTFGKMLKVRGTGGTGQNMFAINETDDGFESAAGYDYLIGSQRLNAQLVQHAYKNNEMIISLDDGIIFKLNGTGGGGTNMFAIAETDKGLESVPGYNYLVGSQLP